MIISSDWPSYEVPARFRARYAELYGVAPNGQVEFAAARVRLRLPVDRPPMIEAGEQASEAVPSEVRSAWFGPDAPVETRVFERGDLRSGAIAEGPAIVEGPVETTVVPPGWSASVDAAGSLRLEHERDA